MWFLLGLGSRGFSPGPASTVWMTAMAPLSLHLGPIAGHSPARFGLINPSATTATAAAASIRAAMSIVSKSTVSKSTAAMSIVSKSIVSKRVHAADAAFAPVRDFYMSSRYAKERFDPEVCDFTFGNPHEMPLEGLVAAIRTRAIPHDKDWFAYKTSEEKPQAFLAEHASRELGLAFEPADIALTAGAFAAIMVAFRLLLDAGDEAVFSEPSWFCYEPMLLAADAVPRKVALKAPSFDLDLAAIEAAIGPRTRLVIVNSPHNPTGRIYGRAMLQALAQLLERASARIGRRIFLLSDEPYRRLRFDGRGFTSPAELYPWTL